MKSKQPEQNANRGATRRAVREAASGGVAGVMVANHAAADGGTRTIGKGVASTMNNSG